MNLTSSKNWKTVRLGDIAEIRRGSSPRPIQDFLSDLGMPWVKISDATADKTRYIQTTKQFIKEEGIKNTVIVHEGDFIVSNSATPGLPKFMKITAGVHDGWLIIKPDEKVIDKLFLYYQMLFDRVRLVSQASGAVFDNLKTDTLKDHEFPLPSLDEQKEIAEILGSLDDKIELLGKENKTLENIAQTLFKEWFVDFNFPGSTGEMIDSELGEIPEGWKVGKLENVLEIKNGFAFKSEDYIENKQYPIIRTMNFEDSGYINSNNLVYISNEKAKEYKGFNLEEFDLCVVMVGASLGNIAIVTKINLPALQNQNMWSFKPKNKDFRFYINSQIKNIIKNNINSASGSARDFFRKDHFYNVHILIPESSVIFEFEKKVYPLYQKISNSIVEVQTLSKLRDELLNKIFNA